MTLEDVDVTHEDVHAVTFKLFIQFYEDVVVVPEDVHTVVVIHEEVAVTHVDVAAALQDVVVT